MLPIIISAITVFAVFLSVYIWFDIKGDRLADLQSKATILEKYYELTFLQRERSLKSVGERIMVIDGPDKDSLRWAFAKNELLAYDELLAFGLADTTGKVLTFTGENYNDITPNLTLSPKSRRSFLKTLTEDKLVIGEVYYFNRVNDWILPIRVAIRDDLGKLEAVNTSAIQFNKLTQELKSFGFDNQYNIHLVNGDFMTTQIYYPIDTSQYENILSTTANGVYSDETILELNNNILLFEGFNKYLNTTVLAAKSNPGKYNHFIVISVDKNILWGSFKNSFYLIISIYLISVILLIVLFRYLSKRELSYLQRLKDERDYSAKILNGTTSLIVGIRPSGIASFVNPAVIETTKYSKNEIIGSNWWDLMYPGEYKAQVNELIKTFEKGDVTNYEMTLVTSKGEDRIISWNSINLLNEQGDLVEVIGFGNDVTELKKAEEKIRSYTQDLEKLIKERTKDLELVNSQLIGKNIELEQKGIALELAMEDLKKTQKQLLQSEKMASLGILSAGIGHEINNPLNFIKGGVQAMANLVENAPDDFKGEFVQFFDIINEGVRRASEIVKSLSHFSRTGESMMEVCEINKIIKNCLLILQNTTKHKAEIELLLDDKIPQITGSEGKLHQALLNILSNAEQAIPEKGKIVISSSFNRNFIEITIKDDGEGISEENLNKISDPFFTTKPPGVGTGLGLSITYRIIEEHNGKIYVNSTVGVGTEFTIQIPIKH